VIPGTGCGAGAGRRPPSCHRAGWRDAAVRGGAARTWPCPARWHDGRGGGGCARHGRVSGHTGPVHAAALPVASPGGAPGTAAASPARRRSAAAAWWGTTRADDPQPGGARQAGHPGHQVRDAHHPLGERGRQPGPAAGAGLGGRRGGVAEDVFPSADRGLVLTPRDPGLAGWLPGEGAGGEGPGGGVQAVAALVAVAGAAAAAAVPVRGEAGVGGGQQPFPPRPAAGGQQGEVAGDDFGQADLPFGARGPLATQLRPALGGAVAGHRGGQQPDRDGQRGTHPVAVTAGLLLPVPAGQPGGHRFPVVEAGGQQPQAGPPCRAGRRG